MNSTCILIMLYAGTYVNTCEITYIQELPKDHCRIWTANGKFETNGKACGEVLNAFHIQQLNNFLQAGGKEYPLSSEAQKQLKAGVHK